MTKHNKFIFFAGMMATLGMFGCDSNDKESVLSCDESFVNVCEGTKFQRRCGKNHMQYLQECSLGCVTDTAGKSICQGEALCAVPCDEGFYCDYDTCKPIGTSPSPVYECITNDDCQGDKVCTNNHCVDSGVAPECTMDDECAEGLVCSNNHCVDPGIAPECTTDDECSEGLVCSNNHCVDPGVGPECTTDDECAENEICDNNKCIEAVACVEEDYPKCNDDNSAALTCVEGFEHSVICGDQESCEDGICVCEEEAKKCSDSGIPMVCSGGGWVEGTACEEGFVCKNGECKEDVGPGPEPVGCGKLTIEDTSNACEIKGTGSTIVLRGDVLGLDETFEGGMVVVENGKITYVGCGDESIDLDSATVITCPDSVISPGLINAHDHITYDNQGPGVWNDERFDHRHDWRKGKNGHTKLNTPQTNEGLGTSVGEMRQLLMGTTAIFGSGNASGLVPSIDKNGIGGLKSTYQTFPLGDSDGTIHDSGCDKYDYKLSEGFFGPHIGEGINLGAINELHCLSGEGEGAKNIFTDKLAIIHGVAADVFVIAKMAESNSKLIWSPRSNVSLYGDTAMVPLYDRLGITIALGTDWTPSGSINEVRELQCADFLNTYYFDKYFSDYDLWRMATYNGAEAFGLTSVVGKLDKGLQADIVMFKTSDTKKDHRAVIDAEPQDVLMVMLNGKIVYGEENVVTSTNSCETIEVCGASKKICTKDLDSKGTYAEIKAAAKYDLFFCGTPDNEPTCIPMRPREKDTVSNGNGTSQYGVQSYQNDAYYSDPDDIDGDGIPNDKDNCPNMFNPVRPQYSPATTNDLYDEQLDTDGDGMGDICDPYPICVDNDETCPVINAKDFDHDGIENAKDNCPDIANPDQADADGDGIGDVCDPCDDRYDEDGDGLADACDACPSDGNNEDGKGCTLAVTGIQDIRNAYIAGTLEEAPVKTQGVVTAIAQKFDETGLTGFFIQDENDPAGLLVYSATEAAKVNVGDLVEVLGDISIYYSLVEIKPVSVTLVSSGHTIEPITLTAAQTTQDVTDSVTKNPYDSVLVTVSGLTVEKYDETISKGETYLCKDENDNVAYIDDYVMGKKSLGDIIEAGTTYDVTGILVYDYKRSKIAPRSADDLFAGFGMKSLVASTASADWGTEVEVTLTMSAPAEENTTIAIACGNAECPASVTIPAGETSVTFEVTMASEGDTTVTASYDSKEKSVTITGMDPGVAVAVASVDPTSIVGLPGSTHTVNVTLNKPVKEVSALTITSDNAKIVAPESVALAVGDTTTSFEVAIASDAAEDLTGNITVALGSTEAVTIPVSVVSSVTYTETFDGIKPAEGKAATSYAEGTYTGVTGVEWSFYGRISLADGSNDYSINGDGLMLYSEKSADHIEGTVSTGVGSVSVQAKTAFTSTADRKVSILIDGTECGSYTIKNADAEVHTITCDSVNKSGNVKIRVEQAGKQTVIDNLSWTSHN